MNIIIFLFRGWIAQSVEQQTENLRVGSSILPLTTTFYSDKIMQRFEIHISDKIFKFDKSKLDKKDKKLYKSRKNSADFLLSRSIKSRIKKRGKFCISHKKFDENLLNLSDLNTALNLQNSPNLVTNKANLSNHIAAVGFSNKKFGLDLEILAERDFDGVIDFCFNKFEKNLMQICDKSEKTILFYQIYTIKEAIIKLENLAFSDLARVGLSTNQNEIKAKNHKGKFINFKTYLLYNRFLISVCFKE